MVELYSRIDKLEKALEHARDEGAHVVVGAVRERLPRRRRSTTFAFRVADCEGYVTVGEYEDGRPGEVFIKVAKQGSTLAGIMDAFSISISLGLQHGVPLATYVRKYANMKFEPSGMTDDADLRIATSLVDYIFRRLALEYLSPLEREELGVLSTSERIQPTFPEIDEQSTPTINLPVQQSLIEDPMTRLVVRLAAVVCSVVRRSATRRCVTSAATRCSAPDRATSARVAARPAAARRSRTHWDVSHTGRRGNQPVAGEA